MKYEHNPEDFDAHYEKRIADLDKQLHQTQAEAAGMRAALERILRDYEHESEPDFLFKALSGEAGKAYLERSAQMAKANQDTIANLIQDRDRLKGELEATAKRVMELDVLEIIEELDEVTKQRDQAKAERDELWGLSHKLRAELGEIKSELWAGQLGQRRLKDLVAVRSENIQLRKDVADAQARWSTLNDELREATQRLVGAVQERDAAMEELKRLKDYRQQAESKRANDMVMGIMAGAVESAGKTEIAQLKASLSEKQSELDDLRQAIEGAAIEGNPLVFRSELDAAEAELADVTKERDAAREEARINKEDQMSAERELEDLAEAERQIESWRGHANTYQTAQREAEQRAEKAERSLAEERHAHKATLEQRDRQQERAEKAEDDCKDLQHDNEVLKKRLEKAEKQGAELRAFVEGVVNRHLMVGHHLSAAIDGAILSNTDLGRDYVHRVELDKAVAEEREECAKIADNFKCSSVAARICLQIIARGKG